MLVGLNKKELKNAFREALTEWTEEEKAKLSQEEDFVDLEEDEEEKDEGEELYDMENLDEIAFEYDIKQSLSDDECFPLLLVKGIVGTDKKIRTSYILSDARKTGLDLFCAFMDECDYDVEKMIAIANFYEEQLRFGKIGFLHGNYHETRKLREMGYGSFELMESLANWDYETQHRLYIVTLTERFCELVRYLELLKDGGKTDFHDIEKDYGFLHLVWKYDEDMTPEITDLLFDGIEKQAVADDEPPKRFLDFFLNADRETMDDEYGWENLLDDEEAEDVDWNPPYFEESGKAFDDSVEEDEEDEMIDDAEEAEVAGETAEDTEVPDAIES